MAFAPFRGPVTAGEGAAAVAQDQRPAQGAFEQPLFAAQVQRQPGAVEHRGDDPGVAGQPAHGFGGQAFAGVEQAVASSLSTGS